MSVAREKFSTQMDKKLLAALRAKARSQGRHIQSVLEEAVEIYIAQSDGAKMRPAIEKAYEQSLNRFDGLYKKLAK